MAMKLQTCVMLFTILCWEVIQVARAARVKRTSDRTIAQERISDRTITQEGTSDRTITQVVRLLQDMLEKSKTDGERERVLYARFTCYCKDNGATKAEELSTATEQGGLLESRIEAARSNSQVLSAEAQQLSADMDQNLAARNEAQSARDREHTSFLALETDLLDAIQKMNDAIQVLAEIGSDQTLEAPAADTAQFLAGHTPAAATATSATRAGGAGLLRLKTTVRQALLAAQSLASPRQSAALQAFLQLGDPFTGTYTAQSGQVVGILRDMRDTFSSNLETARAQETKAAAAHADFLSTMRTAHARLQTSYESKQGSLSTSDSTLSTRQTQLTDTNTQRQETRAFIQQLRTMCAQKATEFEERKMLRANEQAAIAQAVSILNSDAAFETFGTVNATSTGSTGPAASLLQRASLERHAIGHKVKVDKETMLQVEVVLRRAAGGKQSSGLFKVAALLQAGSPLARVLTEIQRMTDLIAQEERADTQQLEWCNTERTSSGDSLQTKRTQVTTLESQIASLTSDMDEPRTGLKAMIQGDEQALRTNYENQKTETQDRTEHNLAYQKDIQNLVEAEALLSKAVSVLQVYYRQLLSASEGSAFIAVAHRTRKFEQAPSTNSTPPTTWEGSYQGQSSRGNDAITMLEFILNSTRSEEEAAHDAERTSQHAFEDSMQALKDEERQLQTSIADLRQSLAQKQEELLGKQQDLRATSAEKTSVEAYLAEIRPGCDFITSNIEERQASRATERSALQDAAGLLRASPAFLVNTTEQNASSAP